MQWLAKGGMGQSPKSAPAGWLQGNPHVVNQLEHVPEIFFL